MEGAEGEEGFAQLCTQVEAFHGTKQANVFSVSRSDHPLPHLPGFPADRSGFAVPLTTVVQDLLCLSSDCCLGTGHPLQSKSCLGLDGEDLVPRAGISQLWSDWFPTVHTEEESTQQQLKTHFRLLNWNNCWGLFC